MSRSTCEKDFFYRSVYENTDLHYRWIQFIYKCRNFLRRHIPLAPLVEIEAEHISSELARKLSVFKICDSADLNFRHAVSLVRLRGRHFASRSLRLEILSIQVPEVPQYLLESES